VRELVRELEALGVEEHADALERPACAVHERPALAEVRTRGIRERGGIGDLLHGDDRRIELSNGLERAVHLPLVARVVLDVEGGDAHAALAAAEGAHGHEHGHHRDERVTQRGTAQRGEA
jgi:hypothetical protein